MTAKLGKINGDGELTVDLATVNSRVRNLEPMCLQQDKVSKKQVYF